jgi:hypothetical protein
VQEFEICNCCGLLLQNELLPFRTRLRDINLGIGVTLFFNDFVYYMGVFVAVFLLYSIFALASNAVLFGAGTAGDLCSGERGCGMSSIGAGSKVLSQNQ